LKTDKLQKEVIEMAKIERFEDLQSWQKARQLANLIYDLTEYQGFTKDFRLRGQIQDAAGSIMHNIAEGFDAGTNPEFIRFLKISRRSASEVQSELYLALDRKYINQAELTNAYNLATETKRLINGMIAYLRKSKPPKPTT
jgi:four helix bundle protein